MSNNLTKKEIVGSVYTFLKDRDLGMKPDELSGLIVTVLDQIKELVMAGEQVNIQGFGVFKLKETKPRKGRNPITGQELWIESRKVLKFYPSRVLRQRLNRLDRFM